MRPVAGRVNSFVDFLRQRDESVIAVVGHACFSLALLGTKLGNAEAQWWVMDANGVLSPRRPSSAICTALRLGCVRHLVRCC